MIFNKIKISNYYPYNIHWDYNLIRIHNYKKCNNINCKCSDELKNMMSLIENIEVIQNEYIFFSRTIESNLDRVLNELLEIEEHEERDEYYL